MVPPQGVHDPAIAPQPQQAVGGGDPVGVRLAGIPEERVGNPDLANHVAVEHQQLHGAVELEPTVVPRLGEEDIDGVLLQRPASRLLGVTLASYNGGTNTSVSLKHFPNLRSMKYIEYFLFYLNQFLVIKCLVSQQSVTSGNNVSGTGTNAKSHHIDGIHWSNTVDVHGSFNHCGSH